MVTKHNRRMKTIISLAAVLLAAGALYSCSDDEAARLPAPEEIKFEMGFADGDAPETRVYTNTDNFTSGWQTGDKVGVYIVKGDGGLQPSGNYDDNVEFTYNNGEWSSSATLYWPNDGQNLSFYAYYPYDEAMTDPTAYTFNVPLDQGYRVEGNPSYNINDFSWAKLENVAKSTSPVSLQFSHALALVQLSITPPLRYTSFTLREAVTDCVIDLSAPGIVAGGSRNDVKMYGDVTTTVRWALVPPQTMDIRFAWELEGTYYTSAPATGVTLTGGKVTKYQLQ